METLSHFPGVIVGNVIPALIVLTVVVFVHEMGHFLVARWCGIQVAAFSIGFGRELVGFTDRHGTRWKLSAVPLGGYVRFKGDENAASIPDPDAMAATPPSEREGLFHFAALWRRALIVVAGPVANFLLAIIVFAGIFVLIGRPFVPPVVGSFDAGSPAAKAGLVEGDEIVSIDGRAVSSFADILDIVTGSADEPLAVVVDRHGERLTLTAVPERTQITDPTGRKHMIPTLGIEPHIPATVGSVDPGSPADRAGILANDKIVSVDGQKVASFSELQDIVKQSGGRMLTITLDRSGKEVTVSATPEQKAMPDSDGTRVQRLILGIQAGASYLKRDNPLTALGAATGETYRFTERTLSYLGQLVVGRESPSQLSGVIGIAQVTGAVPTFSGRTYLTAVLSISIGLFNLFPIPMLDGGHLLFYLIEAVRGRPLSPRLQDIGFRIGFALVIMLFIFVTFNDIANISGIFVKS